MEGLITLPCLLASSPFYIPYYFKYRLLFLLGLFRAHSVHFEYSQLLGDNWRKFHRESLIRLSSTYYVAYLILRICTQSLVTNAKSHRYRLLCKAAWATIKVAMVALRFAINPCSSRRPVYTTRTMLSSNPPVDHYQAFHFSL
jgi:hypothetical protein